jgi:NAD(P)-dependent dehydrogenase (short-subunit alcohol dehydrogenase family)
MSKAGVAVMTQSLAVEWAATAFKTRNPMGRVGRPNELANMAAFLMSDEVANINGEVIAIDGGMGIMGNGTVSNMMAMAKTTGAASARRSRRPMRRTGPGALNWRS